MTNKLFKAVKAVYDFIVYVGCEIGKHNFTITKAAYDKIDIAKEYKNEKIVPQIGA